MNETVYLRQGKDTGNWMYTMSGSHRIASSVTTATGKVVNVTVHQRIPKDENGDYINDPVRSAKQAKFNFHYVLLDDEYTGCDKAELTADGWTESGTLNVETGEFNLIEV